VREVSLVTHQDFVKKKLVEVFKAEILANLPKSVTEEVAFNRIEIWK